MRQAGHLLTVVLSDKSRKTHFWGSVDSVNAKQQNLTIFVCFRGCTFYLLLFENLKVATKNLSLILNAK